MWADSIHPDTGQKIEVMDDVAPLPVPNDEDILKAYTAAVIAKYLLAGDRHNLALAYAGYLLRKGLSEDEVYTILEAAWDYHNAPGEAFNDLSSIVADTERKLEAGNERVTGGNTLTEMIPGMTDALSRAWGWDRTLTPEEKDEVERQERTSRAQEAWPVCESLATEENILHRIQGLLKDDGLVGEKTNAAIRRLPPSPCLGKSPSVSSSRARVPLESRRS